MHACVHVEAHGGYLGLILSFPFTLRRANQPKSLSASSLWGFSASAFQGRSYQQITVATLLHESQGSKPWSSHLCTKHFIHWAISPTLCVRSDGPGWVTWKWWFFFLHQEISRSKSTGHLLKVKVLRPSTDWLGRKSVLVTSPKSSAATHSI